MIKYLFFILFLSVASAKIEDHFKPAPGKEGHHSMPGIDFIYTINLDQRPEKFAKCLEQLNPYGITPYRFSAVNGWELTLETLNDLGVKLEPGMETGFWATKYPLDQNFRPQHEILGEYGTTYFSHCFGRGTAGIALSHLSVLQDAYDSGYETIWVMEDDVEIVQDPRLLSQLIAKLDKLTHKKWDVLFTDQDTRDANGKYVPCYGAAKRPNFNTQNKSQYFRRTPTGKVFTAMGARFGAYSMIVRRSGMKKILDFLKTYKIFLPYDMEFYLPDGIRLFAVQQDVVTTQTRAPSDNGAPNYLNNR